MTARLAIVIAVGLGLLGAGLANGGTTTVSATAQVTGSGTSYRLSVTNTGTEPILCFGLLLNGVQPLSASGPSGVLTRVGVFQGKGLVHMQGNPVVAPGATVTADFKTNVPIPATAVRSRGAPVARAVATNAEIRYSATCQPGSDVFGTATLPPAQPPPPPPPPPPCECEKLTVTASNYSSKQVETGPTTLKLKLRWIMSCSQGDGECAGLLKLGKPAGSDIVFEAPTATDVSCAGKCDPAGATSAAGVVNVRMRSVRTLDFDNRAGKTVVFPVRRFCVRAGRNVSVGTTRIRLVFAGTGFLDKKKSDLNGNGKPDGADR